MYGPDNQLYAFTGDGGSGGDPDRNAQDTDSLLGKVLRMTPNLSGGASFPAGNPYVGEPGQDAIWAIGLRNPWRASFDRGSGALYIGDVGQDALEEINRVAGTTAGVNYGWSRCEGTNVYHGPGPCTSGGLTGPISQYGHTLGCAVTGGYVYRGEIYTDMIGEYVFGDFCSGRIWTITHGTSTRVQHRDTTLGISSFGESEGGEIYMTDINGGRLYKIVAPPFSDVASSIFVDEITWLAGEDITSGCSATQYCPTGYVFRAHMAAFLVRALNLPYVDEDYFSDDDGPYEADINALADAGIATGCGGGKFCPGARVTRAQMASFLVRGFDLPPTGTDYFTDDNSSLHENDINALRASGITGGCTATTYCPNQFITREQMAAFLYRALPH
jgi:hypothetical protein